MKRIVVIGSKGQLGNELQELALQYKQYEFFFYDKDELDIVIKEEVFKKIGELHPHYLINCAAYTAVDKAETDIELAQAINSDAVRNLASACTENGVSFLHISTDYVFDGLATQPYKEDAAVNPMSVYGKTKLEGEKEALNGNKDAIIIRTAWVYSVFGSNFLKTMCRLMKSKPELNVVADQFGSPTYAADLAAAIMQIIASGNWTPGIYHFTNDGVISWFDFANEIKSLLHSPCIVRPIPTEQYPTPAQRPKYSVLDKSKIQQTYSIQLKDWKQSLHECFQKLPVE